MRSLIWWKNWRRPSRRLPVFTPDGRNWKISRKRRQAREYGPRDLPDDVRGTPVGLIVVIGGYDPQRRRVLIIDPYQPHPYGPTHEYWISVARVIGAILLGVLTHDANLLVIYPPRRPT